MLKTSFWFNLWALGRCISNLGTVFLTKGMKRRQNEGFVSVLCTLADTSIFSIIARNKKSVMRVGKSVIENSFETSLWQMGLNTLKALGWVQQLPSAKSGSSHLAIYFKTLVCAAETQICIHSEWVSRFTNLERKFWSLAMGSKSWFIFLSHCDRRK